MALHDWNHNGKTDAVDDFIEYQIYKESTGNNGTGNYTSGGGMSTFGAIVVAIGGFFLAAGIMALISGDGDISVVPTIMLWILCSGVLGVILGGFGT